MKLFSLRSQSADRLNQNELYTLLEALPSAALLLQAADKRIATCNPKALELSAYTRAEIETLPLNQLLPDADALAGEEQETQLITRRGQALHVRVRGRYLSEEGRWLLLTLDPVEPKSASAKQEAPPPFAPALEEHISRLTDTLNNPDPDAALDELLAIGETLLPGSTLAVYIGRGQSPAARRICVHGAADIFPPEVAPPDLLHLLQASEWRRGDRAIVSLLHQRARRQGFHYLATTPLHEGGEERAWIGFLSAGSQQDAPADLTRRMVLLAGFASAIIQHNILLTNLRRTLAQQEQQLMAWHAARENIREGLLVVDEKFILQEINPAAEVMLGYARREVVGLSIENILVTGRQGVMHAIRVALQGAPTPRLSGVRLHQRDGSFFPAELAIFPLAMKNGPTRALIFIHDISAVEQHRLQTQQLEQRALLGEVTAVFAHEVRNPINNLSVGLQVLAEQLPDDQPGKERIALMLEDCQRLTTLMDSVLTFSRTGNYIFTPVDLHQLLERILKRWHPRLTNSEITYQLRAEGEIPRVLGDRRALEQVFTNLISNAAQAMQDTGGSLAFKLKHITGPGGKSLVQVDCADSGPGIPPDRQKKIFEPFFTTNPTGTGLGLSITKQIITAHKGRISLTSHPGMTIFHIQIPAEPTEISQ